MIEEENKDSIEKITKEIQATLSFENSKLTKEEVEALKRNIQKIKTYNENKKGVENDNRKKY